MRIQIKVVDDHGEEYSHSYDALENYEAGIQAKEYLDDLEDIAGVCEVCGKNFMLAEPSDINDDDVQLCKECKEYDDDSF